MTPGWIRDAWLGAVFLGKTMEAPTSLFLALFWKNPGEKAEHEVVGGGYARQPIVFSAGAQRVYSKDRVKYPEATADWGDLTHIGIMDAPKGGRLLHSSPLNQKQTIRAGGSFEIPVGDIKIDFGGGGE
jgi:hypothetical protein